jgi:hypothetical protein
MTLCGMIARHQPSWAYRLGAIVLAVCVVGLTANFVAAQADVSQFDGHWYSSAWRYGYRLQNGVGIATSSNSPRFKPGDIIIRIRATGPNAFAG